MLLQSEIAKKQRKPKRIDLVRRMIRVKPEEKARQSSDWMICKINIHTDIHSPLTEDVSEVSLAAVCSRWARLLDRKLVYSTLSFTQNYIRLWRFYDMQSYKRLRVSLWGRGVWEGVLACPVASGQLTVVSSLLDPTPSELALPVLSTSDHDFGQVVQRPYLLIALPYTV